MTLEFHYSKIILLHGPTTTWKWWLSGLKALKNIWKVRSFVYDLTIERGIVRMRVVFVPRSVEIQPLFSELEGGYDGAVSYRTFENLPCPVLKAGVRWGSVVSDIWKSAMSSVESRGGTMGQCCIEHLKICHVQMLKTVGRCRIHFRNLSQPSAESQTVENPNLTSLNRWQQSQILNQRPLSSYAYGLKDLRKQEFASSGSFRPCLVTTCTNSLCFCVDGENMRMVLVRFDFGTLCIGS